MRFSSRGRVFLAGSVLTFALSAAVLVRRAFIQASTTWETVADVPRGGDIGADAIYEHPSGTLIVMGHLGAMPGIAARVLFRRSDDGGDTFSHMGEFTYAENRDVFPAGRLVGDAAGNVYALVRGIELDNFAHSLILKLPCE